eukprot:TRINITY_DN75_c0_g1_i1.p1 TRINITY_DN75_c0_g1~~TRINITY_DN75_c0_g1_i1.p1  ORF type:complete len:219 (-),score=64.47 TRINITY_DN75_c0_g1_i1:621-1277(-)
MVVRCVVMSIAKLLFVYCLSTVVSGASSGGLMDLFTEMIESPDHEVLQKTGSEIKQIQFSKYNENVFHDSGRGIKEENWEKIVKTMGKFYRIPEDGIEQLKTASMMDESEKNFHNFEIGGKGPGEFGYMRIAVQKTDGAMEYILAGTQIKFNLAPVTEEKKTTLDLYFVKFEHIEQEAVLPQAVEESMKEYFINKALLAAGKKYGYSGGRGTCDRDSC